MENINKGVTVVNCFSVNVYVLQVFVDYEFLKFFWGIYVEKILIILMDVIKINE